MNPGDQGKGPCWPPAVWNGDREGIAGAEEGEGAPQAMGGGHFGI
jgi:hypothetical protein